MPLWTRIIKPKFHAKIHKDSFASKAGWRDTQRYGRLGPYELLVCIRNLIEKSHSDKDQLIYEDGCYIVTEEFGLQDYYILLEE